MERVLQFVIAQYRAGAHDDSWRQIAQISSCSGRDTHVGDKLHTVSHAAPALYVPKNLLHRDARRLVIAIEKADDWPRDDVAAAELCEM